MFGVNGGELVLLVIVAIVILGPERLPQYAAKLAQYVRQARQMAEGARGQLRDQMGPDFDDIDWKQYDPRQYDPRRIVREALLDPLTDAMDANAMAKNTPDSPSPTEYNADRPTPYDLDAT